ncbi:MAG: hypothetical protein LVQ95_02460 [Candidatus Micrarchaeales archaeon]|nr:hypothetical protein [Candidatus Micrarchaeales archaeon]
MQTQIPIEADLSNSSVTSVRNFGKKLVNRDLGSTGVVVIDVQPRGAESDGSRITLR